MIRSLRGRLLLGTSLAATLVLGLLGVSVYFAMRHALRRDFVESLQTEARVVAGMMEQNGAKVTFEFDPEQMPDFVSESRGKYFEVWLDDGSVLARSPSLGNHNLYAPASVTSSIIDDPLPRSPDSVAILVSVTPSQQDQEDGKPAFTPRRASIIVAAEPIGVQRTLALLAWLLVAICGAAVAIMGIILLRVVGRGMTPIKTLANEIESLRETDLARRLPVGVTPLELIPVVDKLNGLLGRLEGAFAREKSFTADVAHELRTPLAGLRSTLEVCRSRSRDAQDYEAAIDDCRGITDRMEAMVQSLLLLARSDAGQMAVERREFDLCKLVSQNWSLFQYRAERRGLKVDLQLPPACMVTSDADKLQIVFQNVIDNAVSYADQGGRIWISIRSEAEGAKIQIANSGSAIAAEDSPRLFERFWRGDSARTDSGTHCGLGLSLSQRVMSLLGGEITIQTSLGGEFIVTLVVR